MVEDFSHATLGKAGPRVFRLGLSGTYRPGKAAIHRALDAGVNYFFCYGFDRQTVGLSAGLVGRASREKYVVATGAYNLIWTRQDLRRTLEKRLRQLADRLHRCLPVSRRDEAEGVPRAACRRNCSG